MSEKTTQNIPDQRSFEERVFARFDDMDRRFDGLETRAQRLEEESQRRAVETKPLWECALAEILKVQQGVDEVKAEVKNLSKKIDVISIDMIQLRADIRGHESRLDKLEAESTR